MSSGPLLLVLLVLAIAFIIWGTAGLNAHPFLVLLAAGYGLGLLAGLPPADVVQALTDGFGGTLGYIGIVIAAGTIIGIVLEESGGARVMADSVVRWIGRTRSALAMSLTGAVVSIPVFCDSGYVVLAPLGRSLADRTGQSVALYAVALSMGLYATHVFVPPTPGPIAAAGELGADIGTVMMLGLVVMVPVLATTYAFARFMGERIYIDPGEAVGGAQFDEGRATGAGAPPSGGRPDAGDSDHGDGTSASSREVASSGADLPPWRAFVPVAVPVLLIALKSIADLPGEPFGAGPVYEVVAFVGDPNTALLGGVVLALWAAGTRSMGTYRAWVGRGLEAAGPILLITGAGGALGEVLQTTPAGDYLGEQLAVLELGGANILLPFLMAAALKTTLGSSTVAIITSASLTAPLLGAMGLGEGLGPVMVTLAIGAGAMTVSHANDSYFWVVAEFSGMTVDEAYRLQTVGSGVAGLTGIVAVTLLSLVVL